MVENFYQHPLSQERRYRKKEFIFIKDMRREKLFPFLGWKANWIGIGFGGVKRSVNFLICSRNTPCSYFVLGIIGELRTISAEFLESHVFRMFGCKCGKMQEDLIQLNVIDMPSKIFGWNVLQYSYMLFTEKITVMYLIAIICNESWRSNKTTFCGFYDYILYKGKKQDQLLIYY